MKEHCELCGIEHDVEPITLEEAVTGAVVLSLISKETPEYEANRHNFNVALEQLKASMKSE